MVCEPHSPTPLEHSLALGAQVCHRSGEQARQQHGQFLTPAPLARFMAQHAGALPDGAHILDPAVGSATLLCAIIEQVVAAGTCRELFVDGFDIDPRMCQAARAALAAACDAAQQHGVHVHARIIETDFIRHALAAYQLALAPAATSNGIAPDLRYDYIIANPPYFKLPSQDPRAKMAARLMHGSSNIYVLFLSLAARLLAPQGKACFLMPRSFCSGAYFSKFRQHFLAAVTPLAVHVFESRSSAFQSDAVLQENVILTFRPRLATEQSHPEATSPPVTISASQGSADIAQSHARAVPYPLFAGRQAHNPFLRLPISDLDEAILRIVDSWDGSLASYNLAISTGPVVPFRALPLLTDTAAVMRGEAVPLLWMHNVAPSQLIWPATRGNKPQGLLLTDAAQRLLVPASNYVLLRRFSAKEDARRLIAAPFLRSSYAYEWVGLENHLNYIYGYRRRLDPAEVYGLAALLNSALLDRYFRIISGTTQVNATELRALPLPPLEVIRAIGEQVAVEMDTQRGAALDTDGIVSNILRSTDALFAELSGFAAVPLRK